MSPWSGDTQTAPAIYGKIAILTEESANAWPEYLREALIVSDANFTAPRPPHRNYPTKGHWKDRSEHLRQEIPYHNNRAADEGRIVSTPTAPRGLLLAKGTRETRECGSFRYTEATQLQTEQPLRRERVSHADGGDDIPAVFRGKCAEVHPGPIPDVLGAEFDQKERCGSLPLGRLPHT